MEFRCWRDGCVCVSCGEGGCSHGWVCGWQVEGAGGATVARVCAEVGGGGHSRVKYNIWAE